jgi:hypothetical protein
VDSVVVTKPGVFLGKTSERLIVRGPKPRVDLIDGELQFSLPCSNGAAKDASIIWRMASGASQNDPR